MQFVANANSALGPLLPVSCISVKLCISIWKETVQALFNLELGMERDLIRCSRVGKKRLEQSLGGLWNLPLENKAANCSVQACFCLLTLFTLFVLTD